MAEALHVERLVLVAWQGYASNKTHASGTSESEDIGKDVLDDFIDGWLNENEAKTPACVSAPSCPSSPGSEELPLDLPASVSALSVTQYTGFDANISAAGAYPQSVIQYCETAFRLLCAFSSSDRTRRSNGSSCYEVSDN